MEVDSATTKDTTSGEDEKNKIAAASSKTKDINGGSAAAAAVIVEDKKKAESSTPSSKEKDTNEDKKKAESSSSKGKDTNEDKKAESSSSKTQDTEKNESKEESKKDAPTEDKKGSNKRRRSDVKSLAEGLNPKLLPKKSKRERKSAEKFVSVNFTSPKKISAVEHIVGRGVKLESIDSVKDSIKKSKNKSSELVATYHFVFGRKGKPLARKKELLEFSGYLPKKEEGVDEETQKKKDEVLESKFGTKAHKMTKTDIMSICDVLNIDRRADAGEKNDKDFFVDRLLDFIAVPDERLTKAYASNRLKATAAAAREEKKLAKKKSSKEKKEESDDDDDEGMLVEGTKIPTDKALKRWVKAYVQCFNHDKATMTHAVETANDKFGVDLADKKKLIKELLTDAMDTN